MNFRIVNCPDKDFKPFVERAAQFYAKELIYNTRIRNNCHTEIRFCPNIDEFGYASIEDYNTKNKPRRFLIEINPLIGSRRILETLAHEMVHQWEYLVYENMTHGPKFFQWRDELAKYNIVLSRAYRIRHYKLD